MATHGFFEYWRLKFLASCLRTIAWAAKYSVSGYSPSKETIREFVRIPSRDNGRLISCWMYYPSDYDSTKPLPVLVNWHGSGFVLPGLGIDHLFCSHVARECGILVVDADYRKAPENPFPAAVHDVEDTMKWVGAKPDLFDVGRVAVSGFSAGGNLALVAASTLRRAIEPVDIKAVVAVYPVTDITIDPEKKASPRPVKPIPSFLSRLFNHSYTPELPTRADPRVSPGLADPESYPASVTILTASGDNLMLEANALAEKLNDGHRVVVNHTLEGVGHAFDKGCAERSPEAEQRDIAYDYAIESLKKALV